MAFSLRNVFAMLGLVASVKTAPAPRPDPQIIIPSNSIGLQPPSYSISWDLPGPVPTAPPAIPGPEPTETSDSTVLNPPLPTPTNVISLAPPSYSVSWDTGNFPDPTGEPEPSLPGPSYSVSWDIPGTKAPWTPNPTRKPPHHTMRPSRARPPYSMSWDTGTPDNTGGVSWDLPQAPSTTIDTEPTPPPVVEPSDLSSALSLSASISWDAPEPPIPSEDPELPPLPTNNPGDPFGLPSVSASIIWNKRAEKSLTSSWGFQYTSIIPSASKSSKHNFQKRQDETLTSVSGDDLPPAFTPTPTNDIGIQPPTASVSWGKREPSQSNGFGLGRPTHSFWWPRPVRSSAWVSWGKRQWEEITEPADQPTTEIPPPPTQTPPTVITMLTPDPNPPEAPTNDLPPPPQLTPSNEFGLQPPTAIISWGKEKRTAAPDPQYSFSFAFPSGLPFTWDPANPPWAPQPSEVSVSWGKRDESPTLTSLPEPLEPSQSPCVLTTKTLVPPCVPPMCPKAGETPCDLGRPVPSLRTVVRELEKRIVVLETKSKVPGSGAIGATTTESGDTECGTRTVVMGCPTFTCVAKGLCEVGRVVK